MSVTQWMKIWKFVCTKQGWIISGQQRANEQEVQGAGGRADARSGSLQTASSCIKIENAAKWGSLAKNTSFSK